MMKRSLFPTKPLDPEENKQLIHDFRDVFLSTPAGKRVLKKILMDMKHFEMADDVNDLIMQNYAKNLLRYCGVYEYSNVDEIVESLSAIKTYRRT